MAIPLNVFYPWPRPGYCLQGLPPRRTNLRDFSRKAVRQINVSEQGQCCPSSCRASANMLIFRTEPGGSAD
jgi:hypothetical protein